MINWTDRAKPASVFPSSLNTQKPTHNSNWSIGTTPAQVEQKIKERAAKLFTFTGMKQK